MGVVLGALLAMSADPVGLLAERLKREAVSPYRLLEATPEYARGFRDALEVTARDIQLAQDERRRIGAR